MPALTPEQEALKQAALAARANKWERAMSGFDRLASPDAILALLAQLEAQPSVPSQTGSPADAVAQRKSNPAALARQIEEAKGGDHG